MAIYILTCLPAEILSPTAFFTPAVSSCRDSWDQELALVVGVAGEMALTLVCCAVGLQRPGRKPLPSHLP